MTANTLFTLFYVLQLKNKQTLAFSIIMDVQKSVTDFQLK